MEHTIISANNKTTPNYIIPFAIFDFQVCAFSNPFWPVESTEAEPVHKQIVRPIKGVLTIAQSLLNLFPSGHHKRSVLEDGLVEWLACDQYCPGVGAR